MKVIRKVFHSAGRWGVIIVLCSLTNSAWAADKKDWLDEMPCIPLVVQAVRENLRDLRSDVRLDDDEDTRAADIVGTLMLLRWIMYFNIVEEGGVSMPRAPKQQQTRWLLENYAAGLERMSKQRLARFESLDAAYMQAEIVIGRGAGKRSGHLTTVRKCNTSDSYSARMADEKLGCYRYWFYIDFGNVFPAYEHRRQILPKLFPSDRAAQYVELVTRYGLAAAGPGDLAATLSMPPGSEYQMPGQNYCAANNYGGDRNSNGLCDNWEKPLSKTAVAGGSTGGGNNLVCKGGDAATSSAVSSNSNFTFANTSVAAGYCSGIPRRNALAWLNPSPAALSTRAAANAKTAASIPASTSPVPVVSSSTDPNAQAVDFNFGSTNNTLILTNQDLIDVGLPVPSCVIAAHGNPESIYRTPDTKKDSTLISPSDLAKFIMGKCPPNEPVVLLSCETGRPMSNGKEPLALQLANELKNEGRQITTVWAPNTLISADAFLNLSKGSFIDNFFDINPNIVFYNNPITYQNALPVVKQEFIQYNAK